MTRMKILLLFFPLIHISCYAQDAREIINHYLDTVSNGDINNWTKITSMYTESEVYYSQQDFDQNVNLLNADKSNYHKLYKTLPHNLKIESYEDSSFTKLLSTSYSQKNKAILLIGNIPPIIKNSVQQDEFSSDFLPIQIWKIANSSNAIELLSVKEFPLDGIQCYEIKITRKRRNYLLYINTQTFLLEYWNGREDEDLSILTRFRNYKKVDQLLIPMFESLMRNGFVYFWSQNRKIALNPIIDPQVFIYKEN